MPNYNFIFFRVIRQIVSETYDNDGYFDITYVIVVWFSFLPVVFVPLLLSHWFLIGVFTKDAVVKHASQAARRVSGGGGEPSQQHPRRLSEQQRYEQRMLRQQQSGQPGFVAREPCCGARTTPNKKKRPSAAGVAPPQLDRIECFSSAAHRKGSKEMEMKQHMLRVAVEDSQQPRRQSYCPGYHTQRRSSGGCVVGDARRGSSAGEGLYKEQRMEQERAAMLLNQHRQYRRN